MIRALTGRWACARRAPKTQRLHDCQEDSEFRRTREDDTVTQVARGRSTFGVPSPRFGRVRPLEGERHRVLDLLDRPSGNIGVELGVAASEFSRRMVASGRFKRVFGVDWYSDAGHDVAEYKQALRHVGLYEDYTLLRMSFADAMDLFDDASLDFIYVDGYAHSGEDGGTTIFDWAGKVRSGGVVAGDDYDPHWPLVVQAVDHLVAQARTELHVTTIPEPGTYPSWAVVKDWDGTLTAPADLVAQGRRNARRVQVRRQIGRPIERAVKRILPESLSTKASRWNRARKDS